MRNLLIFLLLSLLLTACQEAGEGEVLPTDTAVPAPSPQIGVSFTTRAAPTTAVIQTTPTPLPTPTVTPTGTPIIYQIAAGDTILGIALQRGTTVDEILALNPGIVPENLQIGQPVILPPPPTASTLLVQGTAVPLQVRVNQIHAYQTPVGSLWLLGEVVNEGDTARRKYSGGDRAAGSRRPFLWKRFCLGCHRHYPGWERAPFGVLVNEPLSDFAQPTVAVVGGQLLVELGTRMLDVAVADTDLTVNEDSVALSGTVRNEGAEVVEQVQLTATFYDAQGNVTGYQQQMVAESLGVGGERPFRMEAAPPGGETVSYTLHAEAQVSDQ